MSELTGTVPLLRLALRRDRVLVPAWLAVLVMTTASSATATIDLYPAEQARVAAARAVNLSPAMRAMYGPIADEHSIGAVAIFKLTVMFGALVMLFVAVMVRRHTRVDEESGRAEMVGATVVGRHAGLAAAVAESILVSVLLAVLVAFGNIAAGLPAAGSWTFAAAWLGLALVATAVTALAVQFTASARTAGGIVAVVLGVLFVVRAAGDATQTDWLVWLSPFGWASRMQAYAGDNWWPFLLSSTAFVAGVGVAVGLQRRRDVGSGLVEARAGAPHGRMGGVLALQLRLNRGGLIGWTLGLTALGAVLGSIAPSVADFADSPSVRAMLHRLGGVGALQDLFLTLEFSFMAVAAAAYAVSVVSHAAAEESAGHSEQLLSTPTSRGRLWAAVSAYALVAPVVLMTGFGLGAGISFGLGVGGVWHQIGRLVPAAWAQLPAVWLVAALAVLLFALRARWAVLAWALLVGFLVVGQIGELIGLPDWVINASPFAHTPRMPSSAFTLDAGLVTLLALAVAALGAGWAAYRFRDVG